MSSPLRLVTPAGASSETAVGAGAAPVRVGDVVHVLEPVRAPSGRVVRRGRYPVLAVEPGGAVVSPWRPDTSGLSAMYQRPSEDERQPPSSGGRGVAVPIAAQDTTVRLLPGEWTHYADGGVRTIDDHPLQTD